MPKHKAKNRASVHGRKRFDQRYEGVGKPEELASSAIHYGIHYTQIPTDNPLSEFVWNKKRFKDKKIRLIRGYVVVLSKGLRMITVYPIPDEYGEAYDALRPIEEENRKRWKRERAQRSGKVA